MLSLFQRRRIIVTENPSITLRSVRLKNIARTINRSSKTSESDCQSLARTQNVLQ